MADTDDAKTAPQPSDHLLWRLVNRRPFNSPMVHEFAGTWLLAIWFACLTLGLLVYLLGIPPSLGFDVRLYGLAAKAWLAGSDPWAPTLFWDQRHPAISYAGPPPTLIPFIALSWIPDEGLVLLVLVASVATALWTLRRLGLPVWWMLFPPIVQGIWVGNLNIFVIALLVWGGTLGGGVATVLKSYAAVPLVLLGRWKPLVAAGVVMVATVPFLPWAAFIAEFPTITAALAAQAWGGDVNKVLHGPVLVVGAVTGLILLGRRQAAWLAVPALWPATQLHYAVLALPAMTPVIAFFAAINEPGFFAVGVLVAALWDRRHRLHTKPPGAQTEPRDATPPQLRHEDRIDGRVD
jgi:hypothetical protein